MTLSANNVSKSFGGVAAVSDVSLSLKPGEIHGLIGPNGSGKTTLLNMLCGYLPVDEGLLTLDGADVRGTPVAARARMGLGRSFQKPRLLESLTLIDNVMIGAWQDHKPNFFSSMLALPSVAADEKRLRARAKAILATLGLEALSDRRAEVLGHAEQKFTEIARALMPRPRYLLLDEPAGGLTTQEIERLGRIIRAIAAAGVGVLLVEHHTEFVFEISDAVTTLSLGKVIAVGSPAEVSTDPEVIRVYLGNG